MSVGLQIDLQGLPKVVGTFRRLSHMDFRDLLDNVGQLVENQVRDRIKNQRTDPSGAAWDAWSDEYALTRRGGHELLQSTGALVDSIQHIVRGFEVEIGTNLVYGATHQYGDTRLGWGTTTVTIPARPYLGLSKDDEDDVYDIVTRFLNKIISGGLK